MIANAVLVDTVMVIVLVAIILGFGFFSSWDLGVTLDREVRAGRLHAEQQQRAAEDEAWAAFLEAHR